MTIHEKIKPYVEEWRKSKEVTSPSNELYTTLLEKVPNPRLRRPMSRIPSGVSLKLQRAFGHFRASRRNEPVLNTVYTFGTGGPAAQLADDTRDYDVNATKHSAAEFLRHLSELADRHRSFRNGEPGVLDPLGYSKFVLTGPTGCGKTLFLNFLMTCRRAELDQAKICFVRVSLARPIVNWDVLRRLRHQAGWIIREKYLDNEEHPDVTETDFVAWLVENGRDPDDAATVARAVSNLEKMPHGVDEPSRDIAGSMVELPEEFDEIENLEFRALVDYMESRGYVFFHMFDGLDSPTPSTRHKRIFEGWLDQAEAFFYASRFRGILLIALRDESYTRLRARYFSQTQNAQPLRRLRLRVPDPMQMVATRFGYFARTDSDMSQILSSNLFQLLLRYIAAGLRVEPRECLAFLLQLLQQDARKLMTVLTICVDRLIYIIGRDQEPRLSQLNDDRERSLLLDEILRDFLGKIGGVATYEEISAAEVNDWNVFIRRKSHEAMNALCHGAFAYHQISVSFSAAPDSDDGLGYETTDNPDHERLASFLPNVFNFPTALTGGPEAECNHGVFPLLKMFVLLVLNEVPGNWERIENLAATLSRAGAPRPMVLAVLEVLGYSGLVEFRVANGKESICITDSGRKVIDGFPANHNYILNIVETIPIPVDQITSYQLFDTDDLKETDASRARFIARMHNALVASKYLEQCFASSSAEMKKASPSATNVLGIKIETLCDSLVQGIAGIGQFTLNRKTRMANWFATEILGEQTVNDARILLGIDKR